MRLVVPRRGEKKGLLDLAARNASLAYDVRFNAQTVANYEALETLRAVLALPSLPRRIDCFDISTIQGSETVASMVVCEDGRMRKSEYKKFRIRSEGDGRFLDDFAAMHQVVQRRYRRVLEDGGPFPDLIVIDGGKGQLTRRLRGARVAGPGEPDRHRPGEAGRADFHARPRRADRAGEVGSGAAACCSAFATKRTASR